MTQQQTSIPVISLWNRLVVPLTGDVSDHESEALTSAVLGRIRDGAPEGLAIDVSGVWVLDSHLCAVIARLAAAARLMGVEVVLCGMTPHVVLTLQAMGIELAGVRTARGLEEALELLHVDARAGSRWSTEAALEDDPESFEAELQHAGEEPAVPAHRPGPGQRSMMTSVASS